MGFALFQGFLIIFVFTALLIFWFLKGTFLFCRGTMLKIKGGNQKIAGMMIKGGWIRVIIPVIVVIIIWGCNSFSKFAEEKKEENFIIYAVQNRDYEFVKELLESGVSPESNDYDFFKGNLVSSGGYYNTALCEAVDLNDYEMVELLLQYGADPYYENVCGNTPFMKAMKYEYYDMIELFFSYGADPTAYLEEACRKADVEAVRKLLEYGADPDVMVDANNTLLNYVDKKAEIQTPYQENFKIISELLKENLRENK